MIEIPSKLLNILACPFCKTRVYLNKSKNNLICSSCKAEFQIEGNIPIMLSQSAQNIINKDFQIAQKTRLKIEANKIIKLLKPPSPGIHVGKLYSYFLENMDTNATIINLGSKSDYGIKKIVNIDIIRYPNVDVVGDGHELPFEDASVDGVIMKSVIQYLKNPIHVINEISRVCKPGAYVFVEAPFLQGITFDPIDYARYTPAGMDELFSSFERMNIEVSPGPSASLAWILREYFAVFFDNHILYKTIKLIMAWVTFPIRYLDLFLVKKKNPYLIASGFRYLYRKKQ
jgi:uncharacterized protein YbaR (Trm112 family)/SAM-dependent methyltransferase